MVFCNWLILAFVATTPTYGAPVQQAVVNLFVISYEAYQQYAWGHDDLLPVDKSFTDGRNSWGASIADALGIMWLMGFHDWFEAAVNRTATVDFSRSQTDATSDFSKRSMSAR